MQNEEVPGHQASRRGVRSSDWSEFASIGQISLVARDAELKLLWCNDHFAHEQGTTAKALQGTALSSIITRSAADERGAAMQPVLDTGQPSRYYQMWRGRRSLTRVWRLDPNEFGKHGYLIMVEPALVTANQGTDIPTLRTADLDGLGCLTRRELEVLQLIAEGNSAAEAADKLSRSVRTVENHVAAMHAKLGFSRRAELTRFAVERGVLAFTREQWATIAANARE